MDIKRWLTNTVTMMLLASMVLVACGQRDQEPVERVETVVITETVEGEPIVVVKTVEVEVVATPEAATETKPITLNWNLRSDPPTIDPGLSADVISIDLVNNLFVSLTRYHPITGEVEPYLATDWWNDKDSDGNPVWTFKLRNDIPWVHYDPLTGEVSQIVDEVGKPRFVDAYDVEYGVKRVIDPATASDYAGVLYVIKNAMPINIGEVGYTLDMLGVKALDETTLQYTLEYDAAYFPAIAGMWVADPLPQWAIGEWGDKWTEAGLIHTSGPYMLESWIHGLEVDMVKNPYWVQAEEVQIERVEGVIIERESTAFNLYENNELDLVEVPIRDLDRVRADPVLGQEFYSAPEPCTYSLGFTNNKPPFDDVRVRRAITQAIDRQSLIDYVLKGGEIPATSFAPPGIFGAPPPGQVGLHYNPEAAKASLQEYLDETGMTLDDFNAMNIHILTTDFELNNAIVGVLQQMWQDVLGVKIKHDVQEYKVYLDTLGTQTPLEEMPHIWRMGWCADYADESNWVHDVFNIERGGNTLRRNCLDPNCNEVSASEFDELTKAAALEPDPAKRMEMYAEAERILSEQEVAYAPLYHSTKSSLTKPWLLLNHPLLGGVDIYNWKLDWGAKLAAQRK